MGKGMETMIMMLRSLGEDLETSSEPFFVHIKLCNSVSIIGHKCTGVSVSWFSDDA